MSKLTSRLLVFFIGVPLVLALIVLPYYNHIALHTLLLFVSIVSSMEMYNIFSKKHDLFSKKFVVGGSLFISLVSLISSILPAFGIKNTFGNEIITFAYILVILAFLFYEVFTSSVFEKSNLRIASSVFVITYTGFLPTFISRMTTWNLDGQSITIPAVSIFILMVFLTDSIAWLLGILFGKNNRGIIKASPNKSIMGFIGGYIGSVSAGLLGYFIWPQIFASGPNALVKTIFLGIVIAFSSIVGDLTESVFKRSSDVKDSGTIIPGRGGMLDSIDSIVMSAPIYFIFMTLLFGPFN